MNLCIDKAFLRIKKFHLNCKRSILNREYIKLCDNEDIYETKSSIFEHKVFTYERRTVEPKEELKIFSYDDRTPDEMVENGRVRCFFKKIRTV